MGICSSQNIFQWKVYVIVKGLVFFHALNPCPADLQYINFESSVDSDQLASSEASQSGSAQFSMQPQNSLS